MSNENRLSRRPSSVRSRSARTVRAAARADDFRVDRTLRRSALDDAHVGELADRERPERGVQFRLVLCTCHSARRE